MTSETRPVPPGFQQPDLPVGEAGATVRSGQQGPEAWRADNWAAAPWPQRDVPPVPPAAPPATAVARAPGTRTAARRAAAARARGERAGMAGALSYGAILVCVAAGVFIAWHEGSRGGGRGGAIAGAALIVAAVVRLLLPPRLAGLFASRHRVTDVITLTVFGAGLLIAGLVLPRLGPLSAIRGEWLARL